MLNLKNISEFPMPGSTGFVAFLAVSAVGTFVVDFLILVKPAKAVFFFALGSLSLVTEERC